MPGDFFQSPPRAVFDAQLAYNLLTSFGEEIQQTPVVFIGPYEHHSNELPWRESVADVVTIRQDGAGALDLAHLEYELRRHADRSVKIGSAPIVPRRR